MHAFLLFEMLVTDWTFLYRFFFVNLYPIGQMHDNVHECHCSEFFTGILPQPLQVISRRSLKSFSFCKEAFLFIRYDTYSFTSWVHMKDL